MLMEDDKKSKFCPTSASSRKMAAVHGSCGASPAPSWPFPLTTGVRPAEDKDKIYSHNPALQAAEEAIVALNG